MKLLSNTSSKGITLIEMVIAISLSSILVLTLMGAYGSVVRVTGIQTSQSKTQNQFLSAYRLLEKDVRMSGCNLPGNGLYPLLESNGKASLILFSNYANKKARLSIIANTGDSKLLVDSCKGVAANQWVCLAKDSIFSYYQISRVGLHSGVGFDTVELDSTISTSWAQGMKIYFATGIKYAVDSMDGKWCLVRHSIASDYDYMVGPSIDSVYFTPKDSLGAAIGNKFAKAHFVGITLATHLKLASPNPLTVNSFDVKLRNFL